ncbi:MAG: thiamine pyrophosphate-dependent enzyme [Longimicrobiales bacterium]|nr:thiamine pyrophosphate-dependent enzyme [Longimicrobiales bacterium]
MSNGTVGDPAAPAYPLENAAERPPLLLGDEAVALGALHAGISAAYAYPGTPSTEIFEYLEPRARSFGVTAHWCANEKTAYEQALGVSMAGGRVLVSMKHVGLNVAMDPFVNSALVGIRGGLVVAVADDPGMHSSQNEQDSRILADFAGVPCLEPGNQQEAYDMTREAFSWSERHRVPVVLRMVTRLCHGRAEVVQGFPLAPLPPSKPADPREWTLLPAYARRLRKMLLDSQHDVRVHTGESPWNRLDIGAPYLRRGIITSGIARNYLFENLDDLHEDLTHLHVGAHPVPQEMILSLAAAVDEILVLEEGEPYLERRIRGLLPVLHGVRGKDTGDLPPTGELTPDDVRRVLGLPARRELPLGLTLPGRPPQLCNGCPHRDAFQAIGIALEGHEESVVAGDIGCYTLGALPPFEALESCVCMGASIGMAKGASDAGLRPALAVIGDSTFLHSGITPLLDAAAHDTDMTVLILDNGTVAMTGQQPPVVSHSGLEAVVRGLGVAPDHLHVVPTHPKRVPELADLIRREIAHPGLSVIIAVRECIESARKHKAADKLAGEGGDP